MPIAYRAIALGFGYVEDHFNSWLTYSADDKSPDSRKEALYSLTEYLFQKYAETAMDRVECNNLYKWHMAKCCRTAWGARDRNNPPARCPSCEARFDVEVKYSFSERDWQTFLKEIGRGVTDSYGSHEDYKNPYGWNPWNYVFNVPQHQMVLVAEKAEVTLTLVLYDIHPELQPEKFEMREYLKDEYTRLLDESCIWDGSRYAKPKEIMDHNCGYKETVIHDYDNGAQATMVNGFYSHIKYNTGDQIWLDHVDGKYKVIRVLTHDGIEM